MNQQCKVCGEPAAGFHFGAFTCEGCKSFFGRTYNNLSSISECKNNGECVINKKNRTACKACRLRKCILVGMSKSGSRYGRRSNWFKIHCLLQEQQQQQHHHNHNSSHHQHNQKQQSLNGGPAAPLNRNGQILSESKLERNVAKYLENLGTNINSYRIRNTINNNNSIQNNNNNIEDHKFPFYDSNLPSSSQTDDDDNSNSNQSSSINVDEEESIRDDSAAETVSFHSFEHNGTRRFRPGIESMSPFTQKYHDFMISPFHSPPALLDTVTTPTSHFEIQESPIDLSFKSSSDRLLKPSQMEDHIAKIAAAAVSSPKVLHRHHHHHLQSTSIGSELEKRNPLDLTLIPRCNPIVG